MTYSVMCTCNFEAHMSMAIVLKQAFCLASFLFGQAVASCSQEEESLAHGVALRVFNFSISVCGLWWLSVKVP